MSGNMKKSTMMGKLGNFLVTMFTPKQPSKREVDGNEKDDESQGVEISENSKEEELSVEKMLEEFFYGPAKETSNTVLGTVNENLIEFSPEDKKKGEISENDGDFDIKDNVRGNGGLHDQDSIELSQPCPKTVAPLKFKTDKGDWFCEVCQWSPLDNSTERFLNHCSSANHRLNLQKRFPIDHVKRNAPKSSKKNGVKSEVNSKMASSIPCAATLEVEKPLTTSNEATGRQGGPLININEAQVKQGENLTAKMGAKFRHQHQNEEKVMSEPEKILKFLDSAQILFNSLDFAKTKVEPGKPPNAEFVTRVKPEKPLNVQNVTRVKPEKPLNVQNVTRVKPEKPLNVQNVIKLKPEKLPNIQKKDKGKVKPEESPIIKNEAKMDPKMKVFAAQSKLEMNCKSPGTAKMETMKPPNNLKAKVKHRKHTKNPNGAKIDSEMVLKGSNAAQVTQEPVKRSNKTKVKSEKSLDTQNKPEKLSNVPNTGNVDTETILKALYAAQVKPEVIFKALDAKVETEKSSNVKNESKPKVKHEKPTNIQNQCKPKVKPEEPPNVQNQFKPKLKPDKPPNVQNQFKPKVKPEKTPNIQNETKNKPEKVSNNHSTEKVNTNKKIEVERKLDLTLWGLSFIEQVSEKEILCTICNKHIPWSKEFSHLIKNILYHIHSKKHAKSFPQMNEVIKDTEK